MVVCEAKVLLYDLNTRKPYEVLRGQLDNKAPTSVSFLFRGGPASPGGKPDAANLMASPVLAIGCADGAVRLLHLATLRVRVMVLSARAHSMAAQPADTCGLAFQTARRLLS